MKPKRHFKCRYCSHEETVVATVVAFGDVDLTLWSSAVDNCTACDAMRPYDAEGNCLDELRATT